MHVTIQSTPDGQHTMATDEQGQTVQMYLPESAGGAATGIRPMQMLIMGLGGCSAVDILIILKKKRLTVTDLRIDIEAHREADKEPALWQKAHLVFTITGNVPLEKAAYAVEVSMQKYCSVSETLRQSGTEITWEVKVSAN